MYNCPDTRGDFEYFLLKKEQRRTEDHQTVVRNSKEMNIVVVKLETEVIVQ